MGLLKRQTGKFITSLTGYHFHGCIKGLSGSVALSRVGGTGGVARPIYCDLWQDQVGLNVVWILQISKRRQDQTSLLAAEHPEPTPDSMQAFRASLALSHIPHS